MGNGMCSRKQKRIFQTLLLLTVVFGFLYGAMLYYELQTQLRKAEAVALKYQQHQESLSAQLQGTVNGTRAAGGSLRLPPRLKSGFGDTLARRVPPRTVTDVRAEPCMAAGCPSVKGDDIPILPLPPAVSFEIVGAEAGPAGRGTGRRAPSALPQHLSRAQLQPGLARRPSSPSSVSAGQSRRGTVLVSGCLLCSYPRQ